MQEEKFVRLNTKSEKSGGLGIAGFVLGILSVTLSVSIPLFGVIFGIIGLIFTVIQKRKSRTEILTISLVLNITGIVLSVVFIILSLIAANQTAEYLQEYYSQIANTESLGVQ